MSFGRENIVVTGFPHAWRPDVTPPGRFAQGKWDAPHTFDGDARRQEFDT
jgi:hypothetical protein